AHGEDGLAVWYFGTDPALRRLPLREVPLHHLPIQVPSDIATQVRERYLAVSTTLLYGMSTDTPSHQRVATYLRGCRPVGRTTTFLIFDLGKEPALRPVTGLPGPAPSGLLAQGGGRTRSRRTIR